jgi:uroporphyrin-III C-methyltransferase
VRVKREWWYLFPCIKQDFPYRCELSKLIVLLTTKTLRMKIQESTWMNGFVSIVGAGPGAPDLITVRGLRSLRKADVVVYDNLINKSLMEEIPAHAARIYVGKTSELHLTPQEKINSLLIEKASEGKHVVRLKGGDPFVFGRGGEEALALKKAGIAFEIIPGISAGIAAPAYAGIPVTYRGVSSSFACITGHEECNKAGGTSINWDHLTHGVDTLIFYMGFKNMPSIVDNLIKAGKSPDTPAAVVQWGTEPHQRTVIGTLKNISRKANQKRLEAPVIIIIGEVVNFRKTLHWFEDGSDDRLSGSPSREKKESKWQIKTNSTLINH